MESSNESGPARNPAVPRSRARRRCAHLVLGVLPAVAFLLIALIIDIPAPGPGEPPGRRFRAALAFRDLVVPFQQFGTRLFTLPQLAAHYAEVRYFTQRGGEPARERVVAAMRELLGRYREVDLFLLTHGQPYVTWFAGLPRELRVRLRLVYNTGCSGTREWPLWQALGVRAYVAHPGALSLSPFFYFYFLRRWNGGLPLSRAVPEANARVARLFSCGSVLLAGLFDGAGWERETRAAVFGDASTQLGSSPVVRAGELQ